MASKAKNNKIAEPVPPRSDGVRPVAVIDIGATAIRLRIAEIGPNGDVRNLESLQHAVHLGKDTFSSGSIQRPTVEQCVKILKGFRYDTEPFYFDDREITLQADEKYRVDIPSRDFTGNPV